MAHARGSTPRLCLALHQKGIHSTSETIMTNVMTASKTAREEILSTYDMEQLRDIAKYGCQSGCASSHIYYRETEAFFNQHQDEIESFFWDIYGDSYLEQFAKNVASMQGLKNNLTWAFIEAIAQESSDA